jgi:hypothetical protein
MNSTSAAEAIAQWVAMLAPVLASYLGAKRNKAESRRLDRTGYLKRLAALSVMIFLTTIFIRIAFTFDVFAPLVALVVFPISAFINAYWAVDRLRDIGTNKRIIAYTIGFIPAAIIVNLYLIAKPGCAITKS